MIPVASLSRFVGRCVLDSHPSALVMWLESVYSKGGNDPFTTLEFDGLSNPFSGCFRSSPRPDSDKRVDVIFVMALRWTYFITFVVIIVFSCQMVTFDILLNAIHLKNGCCISFNTWIEISMECFFSCSVHVISQCVELLCIFSALLVPPSSDSNVFVVLSFPCGVAT